MINDAAYAAMKNVRGAAICRFVLHDCEAATFFMA
jgi:hypothetical protein